MVVKNTDQTKPLAAAPAPAPAPSTSISEEITNDTESLQIQRRSAQRSAFLCCGCCGAAVIVLGITALVIAFTLLRIKDPKLAMNSLVYGGINNNDYLDGDQLPNINLIFYADFSLKNPNLASFRFRNSTTAFLYNETVVVGLLCAPAGEVGADRTVRMNVTLVLLLVPILRTMISTNRVVPSMELELRSQTEVAGRMNVLGVYKHDVAVTIMCDSIRVFMDLNNFKMYINSPEEKKKPRCSADVR